MKNEEACRRLSVCRWQKEDRHDPFFSAALDQAARNPALSQWWAEQRELDEILASKLQEIEVPPSLKRALTGE